MVSFYFIFHSFTISLRLFVSLGFYVCRFVVRLFEYSLVQRNNTDKLANASNRSHRVNDDKNKLYSEHLIKTQWK